MSKKSNRVAKVLMSKGRTLFLPVSDKSKPAVTPVILDKWQNIVDLAAKTLDVPTGLIMQLNAEDIEVAVSSLTKGNPYKPTEREELGMGLYCETVAGSRDTLHIPNALADDDWKNNPDVKLDMISYLGMPLKWPDGEIFGTICVLDNKEHKYSDLNIELLAHFRNTVETDLHMLLEREELKRSNLEKEMALREAHHRIKNHLNMLTGVLQLNMYKELSSQKAINEVLEDTMGRIRAIANLHTQIALAESSQVELDDFIRVIATSIIDSIAIKAVHLSFAFEPIQVSRKAFFHTGLLVSELVTNSIKHAFDDTAKPEISIGLKFKNQSSFTLTYSDNGSGLPDDFEPEESESIGMMLISDLPLQMGGSYTLSTDNGTTFEFTLLKQPE